jgi:hypothetical protein
MDAMDKINNLVAGRKTAECENDRERIKECRFVGKEQSWRIFGHCKVPSATRVAGIHGEEKWYYDDTKLVVVTEPLKGSHAF